MSSFYSLPIRKKITRLVSTVLAIALMLMLLTLTFMEARNRWETLKQHVIIQAKIISEQEKAAIRFDDKEGGKEILAPFKADENIKNLKIATTGNKFLASYVNPVPEKRLDFLPKFIPAEKIIDYSFSYAPNPAAATITGQVIVTVSLYQFYAQLLSDLLLYLPISFFFLVMAMIISRRVIEKITQPILDLSTITRKISQAKDYQIRAIVTGSDEITDLTHSFNEMLSQIQTRDEKLEEKIEQRTAQLNEAKQKAEAANKAKGDFLANMSHELRTPMNAVNGFNYLLAATSLTPQQKDYVTQAKVAADLLLETINDVLDLSKISAGQLSIEQRAFSLNNLLDTLIAIFSIKAYETGVELTIDCDQSIPDHLLGDAFHLKRVLNNLVANAIKFTPHGEVSVAIKKQMESEHAVTVLFSVADTGIGIPAHYLTKIFAPFSQADVSTTRKFGGTGLGLSISQNIVQAMGGTIEIESQEGQGSRFFFTLTVNKAATPAETPHLIPKDFLMNCAILLVDRHATSKKVLENLLQPHAQRVDSVGDLNAAVIALKQASPHPYTLLIIDNCLLEQGDKAEHQRILEAIHKHYQLPVILLTATSTHEAASSNYVGISKQISKPVTATVLFKTLSELFQKNTEPQNQSLPPASENNTAVKIPRKQILLVEDNAVNQQIACELLQQQGMSVTVADDGLQAIEHLKKQTFDLVFMDIQMPHLDGHQAAKIIRQTYSSKQLPIIAMTAHAMESDKQKCLSVGMNDYLSKPIEPALLSQILLNYLGTFVKPHSVSSAVDVNHSIFPKVDAINFQEGLKRLKNNQILYIKLLSLFITKHGNAVSEIRQNIADNDIKTAAFMAHTIKGAAANLGAYKVSSLASEIELSLINNTTVTESQLSLFSDALTGFTHAVKLIPTE